MIICRQCTPYHFYLAHIVLCEPLSNTPNIHAIESKEFELSAYHNYELAIKVEEFGCYQLALFFLKELFS